MNTPQPALEPAQPAPQPAPQPENEKSNNVKVAVRVRPLLGSEDTPFVTACKHEISLRKQDKEEKRFAYDFAFPQTNSSSNQLQQEIYTSFAKEFLNHSLEGYNACIFAYGQTGSGKSYTMLGTKHDPGLVPRTCKDLFERIEAMSQFAAVTVHVSFCEIYNEQVRDLLGKNTVKLRVRDSSNGTYVEGLGEFGVKTVSQVMKLLEQGMRARATASTNANSTSSRSHAVFSLRIKQILSPSDEAREEKVSLLRLVDLAGSERADTTKASGARLREGSNINRSLVTLGRVISILAEKSRSPRLVPYRDSILTRLLQDSLGGNSKTAMIACVSPTNYEQTISTLRYADQAKHITTRAKVNHELISGAEAAVRIEEMQAELKQLQQQLSETNTHHESASRLTAMVRFYEEQTAVAETKNRALFAHNEALKRHNMLLSEYLRDVLAGGPVDDFEEDYTELQETVSRGRCEVAKSAEKWTRIVDSYA